MTSDNLPARDATELIQLKITGGDAWARIQDRIFSAVEVLVDRVTRASEDEHKSEAVAEAVEDVLEIGLKWARAKVERPILENEKIRAEITLDFVEAKKRWAEALKIDSERRQIEAEIGRKQVTWALDNLERLLKIIGTLQQLNAARIGKDLHLFITPALSEIGEPMGDSPGDP